MQRGDQLQKYLKILRLELEELRGHVGSLVEDYHDRYARREVTEHVMQENVAVLKTEMRSIHHFLHLMDKMDPAAYDDLDALVAEVKQQFEAELRKAGLARAAYYLALHEIIKVERYVNSD